MKKYYKPRLLILLLLSSMMSCGLFDGTDTPVSYVAFPEVKLSTQLWQGATTHNIKDLWVEIDGKNLGVNALPCTIPFITDNPDPLIFVNAGIRNNGVQGVAITYPFFNPIELQTDFMPDATETKVLTFTYRDNVKLSLLEDFEGSHVFSKDEDGDLDSEVVATTEEARSGFRSGQLKVTEEHPDLQVSSFLELNSIPSNGTPIYLELDYKNDVTFVVGLKGISQNGSEVRFDKILIPPREDWNKIYIDFTNDIVEADDFAAYRVLFSVILEDGAEQNEVFLDNIKLIHF